MSLTEIIFRLFAWARPLLWYYHRLGYFLRVAILCLEDDDYCLWLFDNPEARARFESRLVNAECCLEATIALRVRELLGLPMPVASRPGIRCLNSIRTPASLERLAARLDRLVDRYNDIERLAQLRAARLKRDREDDFSILNSNPSNLPPMFFEFVESGSVEFSARPGVEFPPLVAPAPAGLRIRAPP